MLLRKTIAVKKTSHKKPEDLCKVKSEDTKIKWAHK